MSVHELSYNLLALERVLYPAQIAWSCYVVWQRCYEPAALGVAKVVSKGYHGRSGIVQTQYWIIAFDTLLMSE